MVSRGLFGLVACLSVFATVSVARADEDAYYGPQIGIFMPQSKAMRDALGDNWTSFGASKLRAFDLNQRKWAHDWQAVSQRDNGNALFILTGSAGYVLPLGQEGASSLPYFAVRGGAAYIDYAIDTTSGREAAKRIGFNANAAFGILLNNRLNIEARYDMWSKYSGFTFDGITISARYGLVRF